MRALFTIHFISIWRKREWRAEWKASHGNIIRFPLNTLTIWSLNTVELISKRTTRSTTVSLYTDSCSGGAHAVAKRNVEIENKNRHVVFYSHGSNTFLNIENMNNNFYFQMNASHTKGARRWNNIIFYPKASTSYIPTWKKKNDNK